jgi:UDP-N-acetylmuramoylalanine--D-glutamate ligase
MIVPAYHAQDMREVVAIASHIAVMGDTILLSPACASIDQYKNYQDRGNQFAQAIEALPA